MDAVAMDVVEQDAVQVDEQHEEQGVQTPVQVDELADLLAQQAALVARIRGKVIAEHEEQQQTVRELEEASEMPDHLSD